ncbi:RHS repeat-associated core domain-containing protein [Pseudomonas sp. NyZ480]|uniref:RHS repeat-associated core domain-containing protein n=1 Tax=Pseudomonas sp. NyZ480 TaxID=3035289 RepID=UPI0024095EEC|nr:RHS repeat-associated core domain-containing protein [Pseudomonas sp. NyZ480]WEZ90971.1 RHS repeat-associated core domain-containing protein [Pseudomonas sp. NyZ480]
MSTSQMQLCFYSREGLSVIKYPGTGASAILRGAGLALMQLDDGQVGFYATDMQGSVLRRYIQNSSTSIEYTAYGWDSHKEGASMLQFTGQRKEPITGNYLLGDGYRGYSSRLLRFNAPDSLSPFGDGGLNAYCYCTNDPVNKVDPSGHAGWPTSGFFWDGVFPKRWGLRSTAYYTFGPRAPALKTLSVKKGLSDKHPHLRDRIKHVERNRSWKPKDVQQLEDASFVLHGRYNRYNLAEKYFESEGYPLEAKAARETRKEILKIQQWVDRKLSEGTAFLNRQLFEALPFNHTAEQVPKVRADG